MHFAHKGGEILTCQNLWNGPLDTKATVALGDYSCDGQSRGQEAVKALDPAMQTKTMRVPVGILNRETAQLSLTFGSSYKTTLT
jgi:hypothetical protein